MAPATVRADRRYGLWWYVYTLLSEHSSQTQVAAVVGVLFEFFSTLHVRWLVADHLTSRQETDSPAHLDKRSKQYHASSKSRFDLHSPKALF